MLKIPPKEAKAIKNLDDFDKYMVEMQEKVPITSTGTDFLTKAKIEFLWRYYGATLGYKDHFSKFQEMTIYMANPLPKIIIDPN